jgi:hypothetical protein
MPKKIFFHIYISFIWSYLIFHLKYQYINLLSLDGEKYPVTLVMSNGDIFMITDKGMRVFDSSLGYIKTSYNFQSPFINTDQKAAKTTIAQFPNDYILSLCNDKL